VAASGNAFLYVDGVQSASQTGGTTAPSPLTSVYLGPNIPSEGTVGLDEVALYPTALSAAAVSLHYSLGVSGFALQQSGQRIGAVLTAVGVPASLQSLATGISAVQAPTSSLATTPALTYVQQVERTEQGYFHCDESGNFVLLDRHYTLLNAAATTSNGTFANDSNALHYKFLNGSLVPAEDALDTWNDAPVSAVANATIGVTGAVQNYPRKNSIRFYGKRTIQGYTSLLQTTDTEAASLSQWLVSKYGTPIARVRQMKLDSTAKTPSSHPQMLGRKLWDRITLTWQPMDGTNSAFSQNSLIESIQHDFTPELWTTTWGLSVADTYQNWFILNSATNGVLGVTGITAPNVLAY
jgi:hypothetical protein